MLRGKGWKEEELVMAVIKEAEQKHVSGEGSR